MQLKRIELIGFKSFADKTELEFVKGITAVVGPNGSGKSNISDSIRWVLGEQSARSLRGGKMEDIIFGGSDSRKPVNYGEVSITFDNAKQMLPLDFSEVTVTRRVHRSGDSEYFINKQSCRLKDITELFMDTGIGKEAYSIIGQGRIDEILSTKSEDRRAIFEEASGIVKYKSRKKEAEKKLDETNQNLLRIHDLLAELEDQRGPLFEQSEKAIEYKKLQEQLKSLDISLYAARIGQTHALWQDTIGKLDELQRVQIELSTIVSRHDAQLETQRLELRRSEEELESCNKTLLEISEETEKSEGQRKVVLERKRNFEGNLAQLEQTVESMTSRLTEKQAEWAGLVDQLSHIDEEIASLQAELDAEQSKLQHVALGSEGEGIDELKTRLLGVLNSMAEVRHEAQYARQECESLQVKQDRLQDERNKAAALLDEKLDLQQRHLELIAKVEAEIAECHSQLESLGADVREKESRMGEAQQTLRKWEQRIDALVSRKDTMQEMQDDYDGFMHGVKEVLKMGRRQDGLRGIHGAVAELVKVPGELELAIETALGGALQHVVVSSERHGREAISYLKQRQLGRATFLPLDVIRGRSISEQDMRRITESEGYVGLAVGLVEFEETYRGVISSLLGHVIVSRTLEDANRIAASCQYRFRVVTLEGDVVNPGGSMTGGSRHNKSSNLLSRQRLIDELQQQIDQATAQASELTGRMNEMRQEAEQLLHSQGGLRAAVEKKRQEEKDLLAYRLQLEHQISSLQDQLGQHDRELADALRLFGEFERKCAECEKTYKAKQQEEDELQQRIQLAETDRKANLTAKEQLQSHLTDLKVKLARANQQKQTYEEQKEKLHMELVMSSGDKEQNQQLKSRLEQDLALSEQEYAQLSEKYNHLHTRRRNLSDEIEYRRATRADLHAKLQQEEDKTREQRQQLKETEDELHRVEVQANRLDVELDNLLKKLSEEYGLSYELAKERYAAPEDVELAGQQVKQLKREITMLGDVNLGAIEEYARVSERYEFLSTQQNDLLEARQALYHVIEEMEAEMSNRFRQTFEAIRSHFVVVFTKLFGGGRADLILAEPDQMLSTGIEIVAQPPGKKLQNLQLLSGGERALTAIALLFSILRVRPVPFCVLDEVEAALDEANVARFAEYLREFSNETQFIVVTHRKGTMEEADVLYGVTMEEGGVSKLVSVRLDDESGLVSA